MTATITYLLSRQGQQAHLAATGIAAPRQQTKTIEVNADDLDLLDIDDAGNAYLALTARPYDLRGRSAEAAVAITRAWDILGSTKVPEIASIDTDILALVRGNTAEHDREVAEQKAKQEAEVAEQMAACAKVDGRIAAILDALGDDTDPYYPLNNLIRDSGLGFYVRDNPGYLPLATAANKRLEIRYDAYQYARKAEADKEKAEKEKAEKEREKAKEAYIAAWIPAHADWTVREQFAEGLLSRQAALDVIAEDAFKNLPAEASYNGDFCDETDCPCGTKDLRSIPTSRYPVWREVKGKLPEGYKVGFFRVRECLHEEQSYDGCVDEQRARKARYFALVTIPYGPFQFERRIEL
jgi:hypothetical protein